MTAAPEDREGRAREALARAAAWLSVALAELARADGERERPPLRVVDGGRR